MRERGLAALPSVAAAAGWRTFRHTYCGRPTAAQSKQVRLSGICLIFCSRSFSFFSCGAAAARAGSAARRELTAGGGVACDARGCAGLVNVSPPAQRGRPHRYLLPVHRGHPLAAARCGAPRARDGRAGRRAARSPDRLAALPGLAFVLLKLLCFHAGLHSIDLACLSVRCVHAARSKKREQRARD